MKEFPLETIEAVAKWALPLCKSHDAILIINDYPTVASLTGTHGVHLGKEDTAIDKAHKILHQSKIIGGTANTINDIKHLSNNNLDYAGIGPFRFTETKKQLSPLLGLEGYKQIIAEMDALNIRLPFVAIGGITMKDIPEIKNLGIQGIAVSGLIAHSSNPTKQTQKIINLL